MQSLKSIHRSPIQVSRHDREVRAGICKKCHATLRSFSWWEATPAPSRRPWVKVVGLTLVTVPRRLSLFRRSYRTSCNSFRRSSNVTGTGSGEGPLFGSHRNSDMLQIRLRSHNSQPCRVHNADSPVGRLGSRHTPVSRSDTNPLEYPPTRQPV